MPAAALHREALIKTAMRLFRRQGYASTGLNQILTESGAPKGSLYHYFPGGKEELAVAAVNLAGSMIKDMLTEHARSRRTATSFVRAYCATMAGWMEESEFRAGCPIATTMLETAPDSPNLVKAGHDAITSWIEVIAKVFEREGIPMRESQVRARQLIGSVQGALVLARVWKSSDPIRDVARTFVL